MYVGTGESVLPFLSTLGFSVHLPSLRIKPSVSPHCGAAPGPSALSADVTPSTYVPPALPPGLRGSPDTRSVYFVLETCLASAAPAHYTRS